MRKLGCCWVRWTLPALVLDELADKRSIAIATNVMIGFNAQFAIETIVKP